MSRWMIVYGNMRWEDISFDEKKTDIFVKILKSGVYFEGRIKKYNDYTKVYEVLLKDGRTVNIIDMQAIDKYFEENNIIFKNRVGLHREIKRYIDFSLNL